MPDDLVDVRRRRGPGRCSSSARVWCGIERSISSRTTLPKRRLRSSSSIAISRSSRLVLLDRQVGVARDPEEVVLDDLHAREQHVEVGGDDLLEQHVGARRHLHQPRQDRRHLDAREAPLPVSGSRTVTASDSDRSLMYGNGWPGSTASGVRTGKISSKKRRRSSQLALGPVLVARRCGSLPSASSSRDRRERLGVLGDWSWQQRDRGSRRASRCAAGRRGVGVGAARRDLLLQTGDADLEELVEVAREDAPGSGRARAAGCARRCASYRTRSLNSSQDSSRLM